RSNYAYLSTFLIFLSSHLPPYFLHSFPTRRSSDLHHSSYLDTGLLTIYAGTGNKSLPALKSTIESTLESLVAKGITDKELKNSQDRKSTRLNSSHVSISYAVCCLKKKSDNDINRPY